MEKSGNYKLKIIDVYGNLIRQKFFSGKTVQENDLELSSGIYFYEIIADKEIVRQGKLIRE